MLYYVFWIILNWRTSATSQDGLSQRCAGLFIDVDKYTCCSETIHKGPNLICCGKSAYNIMESSCCLNELTLGLSQTVSKCCGSKAYNPLNQICCGGHVLIRKSAQTKCCGSEMFEEVTHQCCGPVSRKVLLSKETSHDLCCGIELYNPIEQCCCGDSHVHVIPMSPNNTKCCLNQLQNAGVASQPENSSIYVHTRQSKVIPADHRGLIQFRTKGSSGLAPFPTYQYCGSYVYNPHISVCCSGKLFLNKYGLTQCCGAEVYQLSEEGALCCDGQLYHHQPVGSVCAGAVPYSPLRYTVCQQHAHLPAGQQCCGKSTYDPEKEICCNGRRHKRLAPDMVCCGSYVYSPSSGKHKCCAGLLYDLKNKEEAGCCGHLLLTDRRNQHCCYSAEKPLIYETQPGHSCCGHWYYSRSLWSCCAGRLIPKPMADGTSLQVTEEFTLQPLTDYNFSAICTVPVMLGTVKSAAVKEDQRFVLVSNALIIEGKRGTISLYRKDSFLVGPLAHCSTPVLEVNRTYLWMKSSGRQYQPISDVTDLTSPLHSITDFCKSSFQ